MPWLANDTMILLNLLPTDNEDGPPSYLFRAESHVVEFIVIEEEMEELNEFCYPPLKHSTITFHMLSRPRNSNGSFGPPRGSTQAGEGL